MQESKKKRKAQKELACCERKDSTDSEISSTSLEDNGSSSLENDGSTSDLDEKFRELLLHNREWAHLNKRDLLNTLPAEVQDFIFADLEYEQLFQAKRVSKVFKRHLNSDGFHDFRGKKHPREALLTALQVSIDLDHGLWQCAGYDVITKSWKKLPPFPALPHLQLDPKLIKDHSICGAGGIMCANISTSSSQEKMIVFNPLTGRWRELPPLNHPRNPVLMQIIVDSTRGSYKIILAGSASASHRENLSKITEVFDSQTQSWTIAQNLPGPLFAQNQHQTGVFFNGILYCIAFLEGVESGKLGVVAFSVDVGKWLPHLSCPLPNSTNLNIVQLVDSSGQLVLFSEIEHERIVEHRIELLETVMLCTNLRTNSSKVRGEWTNVISELRNRSSRAGLQTFPEYTCVSFGEGKLCIFDTVLRTGLVYDIQTGYHIETLPSPTWSAPSGEMGFYSMNLLAFSFEPSFRGKP